MEFESEIDSKITLQKGQKLEIGRGLGLDSTDPTLSRKQISLSLQQSPNPKSRVQFEVIGKNPIWVYDKDRDEIRVLKRLEKGEMVDGDMFCLSSKKPVWFSVRREREDKSEIGGVVDLDLELKSIDVSNLDPIKEFGFLVIGHEFDDYPKRKIRPPKTWDWFLEKSKKESDDDDEISGRKRSKSGRRKRKKGDVNDGEDDEWTGESEEDKEPISKSRKVQRPNYYSTRSKYRNRAAKYKGESTSSTQKKIVRRDEDDDETLGGFIVEDDEMKQEGDDDDNETKIDDDEEEDFDEEDDDD